MFDKIIDVLLQFVDVFVPFEIVYHYERGVVLRWGVFNRTVGPGFRWHWPFGIEKVMTDNVVPRTVKLRPQSLTTRDGTDVTVRGVITARISDVKKALLEVETVDHALEDACVGVIGEYIASHTRDEIKHPEFRARLTRACRTQANEYGIRIRRVQLSDNTHSQSIHLLR